MKNLYRILFIFFLFPLVATQCKKKEEDCHKNIVITNTSDSIVIFALKGYLDTLCILSNRAEVSPNLSVDFYERYCWEDRLSNGAIQDIYIVNPNNFNGPNDFYDCDSIYYYNDILRHYRFDESDIDSLKSVDWIIRYP